MVDWTQAVRYLVKVGINRFSDEVAAGVPFGRLAGRMRRPPWVWRAVAPVITPKTLKMAGTQ